MGRSSIFEAELEEQEAAKPKLDYTLHDVTQSSSGYLFDTEGKLLGSAEKITDQTTLRTLQLIKQKLEQTVASCGNEHEVRIAERLSATKFEKLMSAREDRDPQAELEYHELTNCVRCPENVRRASAQCAHVERDLKPNPFGYELSALAKYNIIDYTSWKHWFEQVKHEITEVDKFIAINRHTQKAQNAQWRHGYQRPVVTTLNVARETLLQCIEQVLKDAEIKTNE